MGINTKSFVDGFESGFYSFASHFSSARGARGAKAYKVYWENVGMYIKKGIDLYAQG